MSSTPLPLERRFGYRLHTISRSLGQHMLIYAGREHGINLAEYRVMTVLANHKSPSIKDIAIHTGLDKAHITRALANLVKRGIAEQKVDAGDRRLRDVRLTSQGQTMMRALDRFVLARQRRLEARLKQSELDVFWKVMSVLTDEAGKMLAEELGGTARPRAARKDR